MNPGADYFFTAFLAAGFFAFAFVVAHFFVPQAMMISLRRVALSASF
jgi:hypothetical protein